MSAPKCPKCGKRMRKIGTKRLEAPYPYPYPLSNHVIVVDKYVCVCGYKD